MPLSADIATLRDQILGDLAAAHDYYVNTGQAWRVVGLYVDSGNTVEFLNVHTGNKVPDADLQAQANFYITKFLAAATFQQFVSLFEDFMLGFFRLWLRAFPQRLKNRQLSASILFDAKDIDQAREQVIQQQVLEIAYKSLPEWFTFLKGLVNLNHPSVDEIEKLAEIKASRDVLVHNRGVVNAIYVEKAGAKKRFDAQAKLEVPEPYHLDSWNLIRKVVTDIAADASAKNPL